jgi:lysozyme
VIATRLLERRIGRIGALVLALGLACAAVSTFALGWRPSTNSYVFQGLDVSEAQGSIDWWSVKDGGADFAYLRATMGADGRDTRFQDNWRVLPVTGMRRGAVHVYSLCRPAADQANNFNTNVPRTDDALPAAVEIDFTPECGLRPTRDVVLSELRTFLTMAEAHTGKPMLLKVSQRFETTYRLSAGIPRPVWAVQNMIPPDYAARPWRMWQASDIRRIDGVTGPVNWDVVAP